MAHEYPPRADTSISGAGDLASLQASSTDVLTLGRATHQGADPLNIGVPAPLSTAVRVRNIVPEAWALAADIAGGSHDALRFLMLTQVGRRSCVG